MTTNNIINQISSAFSLSEEAAQTAVLLLEARARTLDFTFDEYIQRYHPDGIAKRDENLSDQFQGYVRFLGDDATVVLNAGKGANFNTFVHECAHVFRRQLVGELREQAEKAFKIENGIWTREKEEQFANGLEHWIKRSRGKDRTRENVYNKGKSFINNVYQGMDLIVDIDNRMETVYERLFEDKTNIFNQKEYEKTVKEITEGKLPEKTHIFLGMIPRIYEELGFQRLPMTITGKHLYTTLRANDGKFESANYHELGEEIIRQLPEQLKKPLCIVQSSERETDIVSIIGLTDRNRKTIIIPIAQHQKGNFNGAEIDVNLVRSLYGKDGFENWLINAIEDNKLLYINKKKTEPNLAGGLELPPKLYQHIQTRSIRLPDGFPHSLTASPTTDVFGFLSNNITRYKETVKKNFPERFPSSEEKILFKKTANTINIQTQNIEKQLDLARKVGYIQGVCECVAALGDNYTLGKKLLSEMNVNKDMAQKYANPETYKKLEQGIFAQNQEQKVEQTQGVRR